MNALVFAAALLFASGDDATSGGSPASADAVAKDQPAAKKKSKKNQKKDKNETKETKEKKPGASKAEKDRKPAEEDAPFAVEAAAHVGGGASTGRTLHRLPSAISTLGASLKPSLRLGPAELRADVDPDRMAYTLRSVFFMTVLVWVHCPEMFDLKSEVSERLGLLLAGIAARIAQ